MKPFFTELARRWHNITDHQNNRNHCINYKREECNDYHYCHDCVIGRIARFFGEIEILKFDMEYLRENEMEF